jgi:hypothetical protein
MAISLYFRHRRPVALAFIAFVVAAGGFLVTGCGGTGSSSGTASIEASADFQDPPGDAVATFGKESGEEERAEASAVLRENLTARQEADFAGQCASLGKRGMETVVGKGKTANQARCKTALEALAKPLSGTKKIRADTLAGEVAALRVKGKLAFGLYHGNDGKDWAMPMEEEGGEWKVGGIQTIELPKAEPKSQGKSETETTPRRKKEG